MPSPFVVHTSDFYLSGYVYTLNVSSNVIPSSDLGSELNAYAESEMIPESSVVTENPVLLHKSEFGMLLERILNLNSVCIPSSDNGVGLGITLPSIHSECAPSSEFKMANNYLVMNSEYVTSSTISATYSVPNTKSIIFGTFEFKHALRKSPDVITVISDDGMRKAGIEERRAYTRDIEIIAESDNLHDHDNLMNLIGQKLVLFVYGIPYEDAYITEISDLQWVAGVNRWSWTVKFTHNVFDASDAVQYGTITISNPRMPNANDISPSYSVDMSAGMSLTNGIPKVTRNFAVEAITETPTEFESLISLIGTRQTLTINGKTYTLCYISSLSALQPRGGGNVWSYTIEFSRDEGVNPVTATFAGISLPNAVYSGGEIEILQSRTVLHSGKIAVDIGTIPANRKSFTCMSNEKTLYTSLYNLIGTKGTLVMDGETYMKCYISSMSDSRIIGDGTKRLYQWDLSFEQETV
jgi:hypothetical protein